MAVTHGKDGSLKLTTSLVAAITDWTLTTGLDVVDGSAQGDTWKTNVAGLASWTVAGNGHLNLADTQQKAIHDVLVTPTPTGALATLREYVSTSYYSGSVLITGVTISASVTDTCKFSFTAVGTGVLSYNA